jgi:transposase
VIRFIGQMAVEMDDEARASEARFITYVVLPRQWVVERTLAWLNRCHDEALLAVGSFDDLSFGLRQHALL